MIRNLVIVFYVLAVIRFTQSAAVKECAPGSNKLDDCNKCFCSETGLWLCTKIGCNYKKRQVRSPEDSCSDGEITSFDNDCNTCICMNGLWACTLKLCSESAPEPFISGVAKRDVSEDSCKDGDTTSFDNGCNTCICGNGHWACTLKFCFDPIPNNAELS